MTIEDFKNYHKDLFELGACVYLPNSVPNKEILIIDRYVNGEFVCDRDPINTAQLHARNMGFTRIGIGRYERPSSNDTTSVDFREVYGDVFVEFMKNKGLNL